MKERITTNDVIQGLYYLMSGFAVKKIETEDANGGIFFEFEITDAGISKIKQIYNKHKKGIDLCFEVALSVLVPCFILWLRVMQTWAMLPLVFWEDLRFLSD